MPNRTPASNPNLDRFAQAIARQENTETGFLAGKNNPGALMFAGQTGATPYRVVGRDGKLLGTFAQFRTPQDGWNALYRQIQINADKGTTIYTFFAGQRDSAGRVKPGGYPGYAPGQAVGHGNNPNQYAANVSEWLNVPINAKVSDYLSGKVTTEPSLDEQFEMPDTGDTGTGTVADSGTGLLDALTDPQGSWQGIPTLALWGAGLLLIAGLASSASREK